MVRTSGARERVTLITGATGRLGSAVAEAILGCGGSVALSDTDQEALSRLSSSLRSHERPVVTRAVDVTDDQQVEQLFEDVIAELGRLDACVNCAGIEGPVEPVEDLDIGEVVALYQVNVFGVLRVMKHALRHFKSQRAGSIINIASGAGLAGSEYMAAYSSSKHAVVGLTRSAAREAAEYNVSVNAVCPGCVESPMMTRIETSLAEQTGSAATFAADIPMKRYARPAEIADLVAYLALEAPLYITGAALVIDGGLRA